MTKNLICFCFLLGFGSILLAQNPKKPNIVFIICDDLNDFEGAFGGHPQAKTPNIDKLAKTSVQFTNAHSNAPVCSPSRNSLLTGVYPHISKDFGWISFHKQKGLQHNKTFVELLKENGYATYGTGKIEHHFVPSLWDDWGLPVKNNYGPFYFDGETKTALPTVPQPFASIGQVDGSFGRLSEAGISTGKKGEKGLVYGWDNQPFKYISDTERDLLQDEKHAKWIVNKLQELDSIKPENPFFMAVGFVRPHTPLHAPDKFFDMFPLDSVQLNPFLEDDEKDTFWLENFDETDKGPRYYKSLVDAYNGDRKKALQHFTQAYLACIAFVDEQVGKVINAIENSDFKNNTIIIFTSDHGWQMGEKQYLFKNSVWEKSTKIPLIIKLPNQTKHVSIEHPVSLIDLYPTIQEVSKSKVNLKKNEKASDLGGYSLVPFLEGKTIWQGPNGALTIVGNFGVNIPADKQNYSYRTKNWRYIRYSNGKEELYNHVNDANEWYNLASSKQFTDVKRKLAAEMDFLLSKK